MTAAELDRLIVKLGRDAEYVIRDLEAIRAQLTREGAELTPRQYETVSGVLIPMGVIGSEILVDDLERTARRADPSDAAD